MRDNGFGFARTPAMNELYPDGGEGIWLLGVRNVHRAIYGEAGRPHGDNYWNCGVYLEYEPRDRASYGYSIVTIR